MISNYIDLATQLQVNGFDLTIQSVAELTSMGSIGFDNKRLTDVSIFPELVESGILRPGYYLITTNESFNLPKDIAAFPMNRTTLFRIGCFIAGGFFDRGYRGTAQIGLYVTQSTVFEKNARFCQLAFMPVNNADDQGYNGSYQNK